MSYFKIYNDGTYLYFYLSQSGQYWGNPVTKIAIASYFLPTVYGVGGLEYAGDGNPGDIIHIIVPYWAETTL
jgi:hypothetical protein